jgi:uncharacterized membrane protein YheB (UPF0754 family)
MRPAFFSQAAYKLSSSSDPKITSQTLKMAVEDSSASGGSLIPSPDANEGRDGSSLDEGLNPDRTKQTLRQRWHTAGDDFKERPWTYISIPIVAAMVGYITNWVGVKMLFYPIQWRGFPFVRWEGEPLGLFGWQGIVPAKRFKMAGTMVDVTITKLLSIPEIFGRLNPSELARMLTWDVKGALFGGWLPSGVVNFFMKRSSRAVIDNVEQVVDVKGIVIKGMTNDPSTMGRLFQMVGRKELDFLVNSGFGIGFLLGLLQTIQWALFPYQWTLPAGGAVVGYITNWIALKWIFEPVNPVIFGPFTFQGMFLQRQKEVSEQFSDFIVNRILTSQQVWQTMLTEKVEPFKRIVGSKVPLPSRHIEDVTSAIRNALAKSTHPIHAYTDKTLALKATLVSKMNAMTSVEFEQVLHPIFQEDEATLILAGAILGAVAGFLQWGVNSMVEKRKLAEAERLTTGAGAPGEAGEAASDTGFSSAPGPPPTRPPTVPSGNSRESGLLPSF